MPAGPLPLFEGGRRRRLPRAFLWMHLFALMRSCRFCGVFSSCQASARLTATASTCARMPCCSRKLSKVDPLWSPPFRVFLGFIGLALVPGVATAYTSATSRSKLGFFSAWSFRATPQAVAMRSNIVSECPAYSASSRRAITDCVVPTFLASSA